MRHVEDVMTQLPLVTIGPEAAVREALRLIDGWEVSHLLVVEHVDQRLVGVVCACDLGDAPGDAAVGACLGASPPITVAPDTSAFDAARTMLSSGINCLPVLHAGRLVGVLTSSDLRAAGLLERSTPRCSSCGSDDHVRSRDGGLEVGFCLECTRKSDPPSWDDDIGGG